MIDIDIVGKLLPNPLTMIVQLCSTAVLFYFVIKLLWNPARKMLQTRADYAQAKLDDAQSALDQAQLDRQTARQEIHTAAETSRKIVENAESEGVAVRDKIVTAAKIEANRKLESARQEIEQEKRQMRAELVEEMVDVAMSAAEKLIGEKVDASSDQQEVERFVREMRSSHESGR